LDWLPRPGLRRLLDLVGGQDACCRDRS